MTIIITMFIVMYTYTIPVLSRLSVRHATLPRCIFRGSITLGHAGARDDVMGQGATKVG